MLPLLSVFFLIRGLLSLTHVITILICSISLRFPHEFILTQLAAGLVAIFSLRELSQRSQLFRTALLVILTYAAIYFAFELMTEEWSFHRLFEIEHTNVHLLHHQWNLVIIHLSFIIFIGKDIRIYFNVTLVELSNINNDL